MKTLLLTLTLAGSLANAQQPGTETRLTPQTRPQQPVTRPSQPPLQEGTETRLTDKQRDELKDWARNSLTALRALREDAKTLISSEARALLLREFRRISTDSSPKLNETLMRMTLNKGLDIANELEEGMNFNHKFLDDSAVRVLTGLIDIAEQYYESDVRFAEKLSHGGDYEPPYMKYSLDVAVLLQTYVESNPDISTQYNLYNKMLGYFHVDMARTKRAQIVAPVALPVDDFLRTSGIPDHVTYDSPIWHADLRKMRKIFLKYYKLAIDIYDKNKPI